MSVRSMLLFPTRLSRHGKAGATSRLGSKEMKRGIGSARTTRCSAISTRLAQTPLLGWAAAIPLARWSSTALLRALEARRHGQASLGGSNMAAHLRILERIYTPACLPRYCSHAVVQTAEDVAPRCGACHGCAADRSMRTV